MNPVFSIRDEASNLEISFPKCVAAIGLPALLHALV